MQDQNNESKDHAQDSTKIAHEIIERDVVLTVIVSVDRSVAQ